MLAALLALAVSSTQVSTWRALDGQNTLVIDTNRGRIIVELVPEVAPHAVERMKLLAQRGTYDGLKFHRVIDWFMAQTGDPGDVDGGRTELPDLKAELTFRRGAGTPYVEAARPAGWASGFLTTLPVTGQPDSFRLHSADHRTTAWVNYCPGVVGMGRGEAIDSANAEFFLMRHAHPHLDKQYTPVGRVVQGLEVVRALKKGQPVKDADVMVRVRLLADMPDSQRPRLVVMDTRSPAFRARIEAARKRRGADFSVCDLDVPTQEK